MGWIMGFEEAGPTAGGAKNMPVACFLGRGRIHGQATHPVGMWLPAHLFSWENGLPRRVGHHARRNDVKKCWLSGYSTLSRVTFSDIFVIINTKEAVL